MPRKKTPAKSLPSAQPLRLEWLDPIDLQSNPRNWREHPAAQKQALAGAIEEVGWAGALLFNEMTGRLIDGHARKELFAGKSLVPVLVGRWTEEQEKVILATLDPLSAMASLNKEKLESLIRETQAKHAAVREMLSTLASRHGLAANADDAEAPATDQSSQLKEKYQILIDCRDEQEQLHLLERFSEEGLSCRSLIV